MSLRFTQLLLVLLAGAWPICLSAAEPLIVSPEEHNCPAISRIESTEFDNHFPNPVLF